MGWEFKMDVEKNRKGTKCRMCRKKIEGSYNVFTNNRRYHLSCYLNWLNRNITFYKEARKKVMKYKNHITIEKLLMENK